MMEPLPFERDRPELLEAVSRALAAGMPRPAQTQPERARTIENAPAYAVWQRERAGDAPVLHTSDAAPETERVYSWPDLSALSTGRSAEDLSREIERDARRFEAN